MFYVIPLHINMVNPNVTYLFVLLV